jgi:cyclohexanecarboxylate-CoA ligase
VNLIMPKDDYAQLRFWKNRNIYCYLKEAAENAPQKVAVVDRFQSFTYEELNEQVKKLAGAFLASGIQKGDVVSFQLPNWVETVVIHQALAMIGAVSNPIIPIYRSKEVKYILNQSNTKVLFIPYIFRKFSYLEMIRIIRNEIPSLEKVIVLDQYNENPLLDTDREFEYAAFLQSADGNEEVAPVDENTPLLLLYTSGTTANPKGVIHTHNTLLHENQTIIELYDLGSEDAIFMPSPVTHITGLLYGLEMPFVIQGKVVFQDIWDAEEAIQYLIQEECTWTVGATPFLKGIIQSLKGTDRAKIKLKAFPCGGADVPPELIRQASKLLNCYVSRVYGSSEYPTFTACGYTDPLEKASCTDGKPFPGSHAKIVNDAGEELGIGEVGELVVKGPEMFLGYIQSDFNQYCFLDDGYFRTGDLAVIDKDGYIEIKGRKKDIIIRGGENISVKEVEDLLYQHSKIANVAIVAMPDKEMGEKSCAFVVLRDSETLTFEEMNQFLLGHGIAKQKLPERLEIIEQMPMTASGKIQKFILREEIKQKLNA